MKQTLISVIVIGLVALTAGAGTYAYFSDTETSTGNTFTAGTMDMKIMDANEAWRDGVTATWVLSNMLPGDGKSSWVRVDCIDNINADHLEITCDYTVTEESPVVESDTDPFTNLHPDWMAKNMTIISALYDDGTVIDLLTGDEWDYIGGPFVGHNDDWMIEDVDGDSRTTLYDLKNGGPDNLPPPDGVQYTFRMNVKLDESAGNDFQGDTFDLTMIFTLNQDVSQ